MTNRVLIASPATSLRIQLALRKLRLPQASSPTAGTGRFPDGLDIKAVKCIKDGGAAGSGSTTCSWTFEIKDKRTDETLATGATRGNGWIPNTVYETPNALGVIGAAYRDTDGTWKLYDVKCQPTTEECP